MSSKHTQDQIVSVIFFLLEKRPDYRKVKFYVDANCLIYIEGSRFYRVFTYSGFSVTYAKENYSLKEVTLNRLINELLNSSRRKRFS